MKRVLAINTGSSSLKAGVYQLGTGERLLLRVAAERIGTAGSRVHIAGERGETLVDREAALPDHAAALQFLFDWLRDQGTGGNLDAAGHRLVHGGDHTTPQLVTPAFIATVESLVPLDPDHLPQALAAIRAVSRAQPRLPQVACFDTAFHAHMPRRARHFGLPHELAEQGVIRYGFHGLSYEYVVQKLREEAGGKVPGRLVIAHLGNGASMAAIQDGVSIDTTMGLTPTGGLVMGTRSGDLDPGVLLYLLQERGMTGEAVNELVNKRSGLLGLSGVSADMRDLLAREQDDDRAAAAVELFCYQAKKYLAALCAALGGLDTLIFTAGIGEHNAPVRERICAGLSFLGIELDPERNRGNAPVISRPDAPVTVRVVHTDEELMIARHTYALLPG